MGPGFCPGGGCYFGDLPVGHVGQAAEHIPQVGIGIDAAASATLEEGVKDGSALTGLSLADKEPVLLSERRWANGVLDQVVVYALEGVVVHRVKSRLAISLQPEALKAVREVTNGLKFLQKRLRLAESARMWVVTKVNTEQASKCRCGSRPAIITGKAAVAESRAKCFWRFHRGSGDNTHSNGSATQQGKSVRVGSGLETALQRLAREGRGRSGQMADGFAVPVKSGNADGGKEP